MKTKKSLITQNISAAVDQNLGSESKRQQNIISKTVIQCPSEEETITRQKRQIFYNKVACLTELLSKIRDNNEWIADLKYSIKKNLPVNSCGPGSPGIFQEFPVFSHFSFFNQYQFKVILQLIFYFHFHKYFHKLF